MAIRVTPGTGPAPPWPRSRTPTRSEQFLERGPIPSGFDPLTGFWIKGPKAKQIRAAMASERAI